MSQEGQIGKGTQGSEDSEAERTTSTSAALLESLMPARSREGKGRKIQKNLPLIIPRIPSTPSNASEYTLASSKNPSTPLLLSAALPSPITPLFQTNGSITASSAPPSRASGIELSPDDPSALNMFSTVDRSIQSAIPAKSMWTQFSNPNFSHLLPRLCPAKMTDSERLERAMEVILDELHYPTVADFFASYIQQIP
ncbi:hypothetical protein BT96DRAFT_999357 [Gymnopus androsaceus JB14]|uniref:Uncharacterized protein n=1 Tax=Gymnopus androsaceus JB14 TaxID=1447944 RepID=A0A6A4H5V8_9AGAR|nr:hypothetical protein BT96DRAFT_999357 [Gymnopus androsaceus JB14]